MSTQLLVREGAEVRVEDGIGRVVGLESKGRNAQVTIEAQHLREPVKAWADGANAELVAAVRAARETEKPVPYRIEVKRQRDVDPSIPLADLAPRQKIRDLVALGDGALYDPWAGGGDAAPAGVPENPPAAATAPPAAGPGDDPRARNAALDAVRRAVVDGKSDETVRALRGIAADLGATDAMLEAACRVATPDAEPAPPPAAPASSPDEPPAGIDQSDVPPLERPLDGGPGDRHERLRAALKRLRKMTIDGVNPGSMPHIDQVVACRELAATEEQLTWALGRPPGPDDARPAGEPPGNGHHEALSRHRDPDGIRERAPDPYAQPPAPRPPVAQRSGLGTAGAAAPAGLADPPPYKRSHDTGPLAGCLNLSSYEVGEVIGVVELAQRILIRRARAAADEHKTEVAAPTLAAITSLARALLLAVDRTQVAVRGGRVDRMSGLYRRAARAVREAIDWYPVPPPDADGPTMAAWHGAIVDQAAATLRVGLVLLGEPIPSPEEVAADVAAVQPEPGGAA